MMRAIVDVDSHYWWGWEQLAIWYRESNDNEGYLRASEWLIRLSPQDHIAYGYLGEAQLRLDRRRGGPCELGSRHPHLPRLCMALPNSLNSNSPTRTGRGRRRRSSPGKRTLPATRPASAAVRLAWLRPRRFE